MKWQPWCKGELLLDVCFIVVQFSSITKTNVFPSICLYIRYELSVKFVKQCLLPVRVYWFFWQMMDMMDWLMCMINWLGATSQLNRRRPAVTRGGFVGPPVTAGDRRLSCEAAPYWLKLYCCFVWRILTSFENHFHAPTGVSQKEVPSTFEKSLKKYLWLESVSCFWCSVKKWD